MIKSVKLIYIYSNVFNYKMINFIIGVGSLTLYLFICFDGHNIIKKNIVNKYRRINIVELCALLKLTRICIYMIFKVLWISIIQYMNNTIVKINKDKYIVSYVIKGKLYQMIVNINKDSATKILLVSDENEDDISNIFYPYLGPEENFHGFKYTPKMFNKKEISIQLSDGTERIFTNDQVIDINY